MKKLTIGAVDLFCGAGGLTRGLLNAGIDVRLGFDVDGDCKHAYEANNGGAKFVLANLAKVLPSDVIKGWKGADVRLLAGCAPCQAFSSYTQGKDWNRKDQWSLLRAFSRFVERCEPDIVTMENVASLAAHEVFDEFCQTLQRNSFEIVWEVLDCRHYGVPQSRKRLVLIASRLGAPKLPKKTHPDSKDWITVRKVISQLPALEAGSSSAEDPVHVSSRLSRTNLNRIKASKPGGTWRDWPDDLIAECHKRESGKTYPGVYGRMEWDAPSPTITGQCYGFGNGRFGHPKQNRAISLREAAMLQTFPKNYSFVADGTSVQIGNIGQMIGNAVPPRLGEVIGRALQSHVREVMR